MSNSRSGQQPDCAAHALEESQMESIDLLVLRTTRDWLAAGARVLLATVARTWGSSPRPVGSMMALRNDGRVVGSVSGGCIEDDLIHRYTTAHGGSGMKDGAPEVVRYGVSGNRPIGVCLEYQPWVESTVSPTSAFN